MVTEAERRWQQRWISEIRTKALTWGPPLFDPRYQRQSSARPVATAPRPAPARLPVTEPITIMIPTVQLLDKPRNTSELLTEAVKRFYKRHHRLPESASLHPLRLLATQGSIMPVEDCEDIGCYTIKVAPEEGLPADAVYCQGWGREEILYL